MLSSAGSTQSIRRKDPAEPGLPALLSLTDFLNGFCALVHPAREEDPLPLTDWRLRKGPQETIWLPARNKHTKARATLSKTHLAAATSPEIQEKEREGEHGAERTHPFPPLFSPSASPRPPSTCLEGHLHKDSPGRQGSLCLSFPVQTRRVLPARGRPSFSLVFSSPLCQPPTKFRRKNPSPPLLLSLGQATMASLV